MYPKSIWLSKTFWFGLLTTAAGILAVLADNEIIQQHPKLAAGIVTAIGVINMLLRMVTDQPVSVGGNSRRGLMLLFLLIPGNLACCAELKLPTSPVAPYQLIRVEIAGTETITDVIVMTVRNAEVMFVDMERSATPGRYVFTGPPGVYSIRVTVQGSTPLIGRLEVAGSVPFPPSPEPGPSPPSDPSNPPNQPPQPQPSKVTRVTYVYEKDHTIIPRPVALALQRINAESGGSVIASEVEDDVVDGEGQIPDQYAIAIEAARKAGLPSLVVQSGATVLRVVAAPVTEQSVMEAAK